MIPSSWATKMLALDEETGGILSEQICFILRKGLVISFQAIRAMCSETHRERLRMDTGRVRRGQINFLIVHRRGQLLPDSLVGSGWNGNRSP